MHVRLTGPAGIEFIDAAAYYREASPDAAFGFLQSFISATEHLAVFPGSGMADVGGTRRWRLTGFSYTLIYTFDERIVTIIAVAHTSRLPGYWLDR